MSYVYIESESQLWTVGFYKPDGDWEPESDHGTEALAATRVRFLNGGNLASAEPTNHLHEAQEWIIATDAAFGEAVENGDIPADRRSVITGQLASVHIAAAQTQQLKRIADALERLTGAMSECGRLFDVRVFEAYN